MSETTSGKGTRKRVLLMATSMRGGGSEHQVALLARHLPRDRFDVHLYLTERTGELLSELPPDVQIDSLDAVNLTSNGAMWRRFTARWPGMMLRRHAAAFAELVTRLQVDVIYDRAFHNTLIAGHPAFDPAGRRQPLGVAPRRRPRRISTIVSPPHVALPMVEKRFVAAKRKMLAGAYRRSDAVIAVSEAAADSAAQYYALPRQCISVIPNPIDIEQVVRTAAKELQAKAAHALNENNVRTRFVNLVCVGRMTTEKGHGDLIDAIGRLAGRLPQDAPRLAMRFIGDGPLRASLERQWAGLADPHGLVNGHRVEFVGTLTPATPHIAAADGLVLPSHFEGMPNVVLEAFALETPVIATRAGGTVQLQLSADEPTCFWAEPRSPESLADAIEAFLRQPDQRHRHRAAAKNLLLRNHTIEAAVARIAGFLAE